MGKIVDTSDVYKIDNTKHLKFLLYFYERLYICVYFPVIIILRFRHYEYYFAITKRNIYYY